MYVIFLYFLQEQMKIKEMFVWSS